MGTESRVPEQALRRFILEWSAILACMPVEYNAVPEPDDFDQQLRDLTSGQAEPAKFTELSAAERLRAVPNPPQPAKIRRRDAKKARELRKPVDGPGRKPPPDPRGSGKPRARKGTPSGSARPAAAPRQRFIQIARTVGVLIAFVALLYGLHLLGFGPR